MVINMNKKLLVIALAAAGLSANAMALTFNDGELNGGVDVGGTITVPVATNQWQWATGDALSAFSHNVVQMTNNYKTLTITMAADSPLLVGQTKAATVGAVGGVGITPRISLMQADGTTPVVINYGSTANGKGSMSLQVVDSATPTTVLGSAVVNVKTAALVSFHNPGDPYVVIGSLEQVVDSPFGAAAPMDRSSAMPVAQADSWVLALGGKGGDVQVADANTLMGTSLPRVNAADGYSRMSFGNPGATYGGAYGLGIASGDNIVVNFTNPITATTNWKAPLNVAVTYL